MSSLAIFPNTTSHPFRGEYSPLANYEPIGAAAVVEGFDQFGRPVTLRCAQHYHSGGIALQKFGSVLLVRVQYPNMSRHFLWRTFMTCTRRLSIVYRRSAALAGITVGYAEKCVTPGNTKRQHNCLFAIRAAALECKLPVLETLCFGHVDNRNDKERQIATSNSGTGLCETYTLSLPTLSIPPSRKPRDVGRRAWYVRTGVCQTTGKTPKSLLASGSGHFPPRWDLLVEEAMRQEYLLWNAKSL